MTGADDRRTAVRVVVALGVPVVVAAILFLMIPRTDDPRPVTDGADDRSATRRTSATETPVSRPASAKPRALSESEPAPLEIEVLGPSGVPSRQARLVIHRGETVLATGRTDDRGIAGFEAGEGQAALFILPSGSPNHLTSVSLEAGKRTIRLPSGVSIMGRAEVDGGPPKEPLALDPWNQKGDDSPISGSIWTALKGDFAPKCLTGAAGDFELTGVAAGSEWTFSGPVGYRLDEVIVGGREVLNVEAPASGVLLRFHRVPIISGRVVSSDGQAPIPRSECAVAFFGAVKSYGVHFEAGDDGRFRVAASYLDRQETLARVEITVRGPNRNGVKSLMLDPAPVADVDVGDLVVPSGRVVRFVARDDGGVPIEGAYARVGDPVEPSSRTDASGLGTLRIPDGAKSFFVGELKHDVVEVGIPESLPESLPVTLPKSSGVEIKVSPARGSAPIPLRVRFSSSKRDVFVNAAMGNDPILVASGATENGFGVWSNGRWSRVFFEPNSRGRVVIAGIKAGMPFVVDAVDALDEILATESLTLGPGQWKTVELEANQVARVLRGRVHDARGQPVKGARALIDADSKSLAAASYTTSSGRRISVDTDSDGRFALSGFVTEVAHVAVLKAGFVPWIRRDLPVPAEGVELDVTLEKGRSVTLEYRESDGTPIKKLWVEATLSDGSLSFHGNEEQPGAYVFQDVPPGTVTVTTDWAGRKWNQSVTVADNQTERITMPPMGKVVVDWAALGPGALTVDLKPSDEALPKVHRRLAAPESSVRELEIYPILPGIYATTLHMTGGEKIAAPEPVLVNPLQTTRVVFRKP